MQSKLKRLTRSERPIGFTLVPEWQTEDEWHPLFVEALQRERHIEYLTDVLLYGTAEDLNALSIGNGCITGIENT